MNTITNRDLKCDGCGALIPAGERFNNTRLVVAIKAGRSHHLDDHRCHYCADCDYLGKDEIVVTHWEHDLLPMIEWVLDDLDISFVR